MSDFDRQGASTIPGAADVTVDAGLRAFMLGVYAKMTLGLLLAGSIAGVVGNVPVVGDFFFRVLGNRLSYTPLGMIVAFAPLVIILFSNFFMRRVTPAGSAILYWTLVTLIGASLGVLFRIYAGSTMFTALLTTAVSFGGLSLVGYTTKRSLSGLGSFMIMGMWGIVAAAALTWFMPGLYSNPLFFFAFNIIGVVVFAGLIAFKTQDLKMTYHALQGDWTSLAVATNYGALFLFISFVNLFQFILALMGGRRN